MINGIRQKAIVGKKGRIEVPSPELPMGARVEIIILIEPDSPKQRFLKRDSDKEWLKLVKPVNVGFPLTEEWLEQDKCEGRE